jgi:hypothetical protein
MKWGKIVFLFLLFLFFPTGKSFGTLKQYILPVRVTASSQLNEKEWSVNNLVDGNLLTSWSSKYYTTSSVFEWVAFDFGKTVFVGKIEILPRVWERDRKIQAFPRDFNISYSDDGKNWFILPGAEFYNFPTPSVNPDGSAQILSFPVMTSHRYFGLRFTEATTDSYGGYFVQLAEVRFVAKECENDSDCPGNQVCQQGVCGINTISFFNLRPGNYWIFRGTDKYGNETFNFRQRIDVELPVKICTQNGVERNALIWRITRQTDCPFPHQCYWGNLRFFFVDPEKDESPYIWATADKKYYRDPQHPFKNIGILRDVAVFEGWQDAIHPYFPPYLYVPKFLPNLGENLEYRYWQQFYGIATQNEVNTCTQTPLRRSKGEMIMRYKLINIDTPAYSGPTLVVSQGERGGSWCTREDWYFAPKIGIVKITQWNCNTQGGSCYNPQGFQGGCRCGPDQYAPPNFTTYLDDPSNHPNCYKNLILDRPAMEMVVEKYYLGNGLKVTVNNETKIRVKRGEEARLKFTDPSTNFTYEGDLEIDNSFISPDGTNIVSTGKWNVWIDESGELKLKIDKKIPFGTYHARFRPSVFTSPPESLVMGSEVLLSTNSLPWSNEIVIQVIPSSQEIKSLLSTYLSSSLEGDLNNDKKINAVDFGEVVRLLL